MKKLSLILIVFILLFSFTGCYSDGSIIGSLPEYENKEFYTDRTVQNFTNFGKYSYKELKDSDFEGHKYFKKVEDKEIEEISAYTFNFLEVIGSIKKADAEADIVMNYVFNNDDITVGDFFCIKTREGKANANGTYGKFDNYSVYFVDMDTNTLYYFHCDV